MSEKTVTLAAILWESEASDLKKHLTERAGVIDIDLNPVLGAGEWVIGAILTRRDGKASIVLDLAEPDEKRWASELASGENG